MWIKKAKIITTPIPETIVKIIQTFKNSYLYKHLSYFYLKLIICKHFIIILKSYGNSVYFYFILKQYKF